MAAEDDDCDVVLASIVVIIIIIVIIIRIVRMEKTEAGLRGLCIREIDVKLQILVTEYYNKLSLRVW